MITTCYPGPNFPDTEICHYFTKEWVKMGHNVKVFVLQSVFPKIYYSFSDYLPSLKQKLAMGSSVQKYSSTIEIYNMEGVDICRIPMKKYIPHGKFTQGVLRKTIQIILNNCEALSYVPDVIVGHWFNPTLYVISKLKENFPNALTSMTLHGETYSDINRIFSNCDSLLHHVDKIGFRSPSIRRNFYSTCPTKFDGFYCYSGVSDIFYDEKTLKVDKFSDEALSRFVYVGRFVSYKYPRAIMDALLIVYNKRTFQLSYVGRQTDMYNELINYVQSNQLLNQVKFLGQIQRKDMPYVFDDAQCLIMISKGEVFGMVYLEAMARGCIVIAGMDSGVQEIIRHGENGFLCEPGNVVELSKIIEHINSLSAEGKKLISENARKTALELSDANVAKTYLFSVLNK